MVEVARVMAVYLLARRPKHPENLVHILLTSTHQPWLYDVLCDAPHGELGFVTVPPREKGFPTCLQCIARMQGVYFPG